MRHLLKEIHEQEKKLKHNEIDMSKRLNESSIDC